MADDADSVTDTAGDDDYDAVRAAFISGQIDDKSGDEFDADESKADDDEADDDQDDDLADDEKSDDEADEVEASDEDEDDDTEEDDEEDPDADLDDDKPAKGKTDADTAKRLEQVRKTDQRLREQREKQFADRERDFERRESELKPRLEAADRFEKLKSRGFVGMIEALAAELGADEDEIDLAAKKFYAMSKAGKSDPKWKAAVDAMEKERARDSEIKALRKQQEDDKAEREKAARETEAQRNADAYVDKAANLVIGKKAALAAKTPLVKQYLENDPMGAKGQMFIIATQLWERDGKQPDHKAVVIELEKRERKQLRRYGIDPKTLKPTSGASATTSAKGGTSAASTKPKTPTKPGDKTLAAPGKVAADEDEELTKEAFIKRSSTTH